MFLKYLKITNDDGLIRNITFKMGLNLIVDETNEKTSDSGNNVGKTTLLYLINYCLGGEAVEIYKSKDNSVNTEIKAFLEESNVEVELCLADSLDYEDSRKVVIRRNFLPYAKAIREINGQQIKKQDFDHALEEAILGIKTTTPSYRQIISHSLRIDDLRLTQPLMTFPTSFGKKVQYENLHLFMFGANVDEADRKVQLSKTIADDNGYKRRLEKNGSLSALNSRLSLVQREIDRLEQQKASLKLNPDFEKDLDELSLLQGHLGHMGTAHNNLLLRRSLIMDAVKEMQNMQASANAEQVENIYKQASAYNDHLHHTFKDLLKFHNDMLARRSDFISAELPQLESEIQKSQDRIKELRSKETALRNKLNLTVSYETFDEMITQLAQKYQEKGTLEQSISQLDDVEKSISNNMSLLGDIDKGLFSEKWRNYVQEQLNKFNAHFADISNTLYSSEYIVKFEISQYNGNPCYVFQTDADNSFGTGKKQGEIVCFDIAYIKFADEEEIPCLHFVLYDKMELVHGNQLDIIADVVEKIGGEQCVSAMLRDKLPKGMDPTPYIVQTLTEDERLFKMEKSTWYLGKQ